GGAPRRAGAPPHRPPGGVGLRDLHALHPGLAAARGAFAAAVPLPAPPEAGAPVPAPLGGRRPVDLGQPLGAALRVVRLHGPARDVPRVGARRRLTPWRGGAATAPPRGRYGEPPSVLGEHRLDER